MASSVIEQIKDRLPITEVLSTYITIEPSGAQFKAKCPFHNERTASFSISPERGLYYCFGCGAKGDIFSFVSAFEGLDFKGTLKLLADRAGVALDVYSADTTDADPLYELLERSTLRYQNVLTETASARDYLHTRGVTDETIASFRIGYAPDEWRFIQQTLTTPQDESIGLRAGMLKKTEQKIYDRFRGRIMFPLTDSSGRVVGFSGRLFPDRDDGPKYLNSPETELFKKSKILFGFHLAKAHIKKHGFAILVEGQLDLVLSHQVGFKNTVAASGTAVSAEAAKDQYSNLSLLSRLCPNIIIAFDGDEAGRHAADRASLVALSLGMNPKLVTLPDGVDPAEFLKTHSVEEWKLILKKSQHPIAHHLTLLQKETLSPGVLARRVREVLFPFLIRIPSAIEQMLYVKMVADAIGASPEVILKELPQYSETTHVDTPSRTPLAHGITPYERLVALRARFPDEEIEHICTPLETLSVAETLFTSDPLSEATLSLAIAVVEREYGTLSPEERKKVAQELVETVTQEFFRDMRTRYTQLLYSAQRMQDEHEESRIMKVLHDIHTLLHTSHDT